LKTRSGWSTWGWNQAGLKKKQEKEKSGVTRQPGQKPGCNPLIFFLLKQRRFDFFKKKLTRTTRSKPETRALNRAGSKNYVRVTLR
jgi:hypothetical protein